MNDVTAIADFDEVLFDEGAILDWAQSDKGGGLPGCSAAPFAQWLDQEWNEFNDESGSQTNEDILKGALAHWRGDA